jgi:hypothetical protein
MTDKTNKIAPKTFNKFMVKLRLLFVALLNINSNIPSKPSIECLTLKLVDHFWVIK